MKLAVGASSRIAVEEAARLGVAQIVASRAQVNERGGYINMTPGELVDTVFKLSGGKTKVIRDHGGPHQNGDPNDDWYRALDIDVAAGFDGLHLDVCKLERGAQGPELERLLKRYKNSDVTIEIGGERENQQWNDMLASIAFREGVLPEYVVVDVGGWAWADRQQGRFQTVNYVRSITDRYHQSHVRTKAHNADWYGGMHDYDGVLDAFNVAPEFGVIETEAWLRALPTSMMYTLLEMGYNSRRWERWFKSNEGSMYERARCALRYIWSGLVNDEDPAVQEAETYVREVMRDAIARR